MARIKSEVVGVGTVQKELNGLAKRVKTSVLRKGMTAGLGPVLKTAKSKCPVRDPDPRYKSGLLKKSLGKKVKQYRSGSIVVGMVGARHGFRRVTTTADGGEVAQDPTKYDHLVEFGTRHSQPKSFLRAAGDSSKEQFRSAMAAKMNEAIAAVNSK